MNHELENIKDAALGFITNGFSVIPVGPDKKPLVAWKNFQDRPPTIEEIQEWSEKFGDSMQLGLITGEKSGITVIDIEHGGRTDDLSETVRSKTGGGGFHFFYKYAKGPKSAARLWPLVDVRNDGGFVVIPPSKSNKGVYEWLVPFARESLADFPLEYFNRKSAMWSKLPTFKGFSEGSRNNELTKYLGTLLAGTPPDAWEIDVWNALVAANTKNTPPLEDEEVLTIFNSIRKAETKKRAESGVEYGVAINNTAPQAVDQFQIEACDDLLACPDIDEPFTVDKLVPEGSITAITADSGKGKSILALIMAKAIASGEKFLGEFVTKQSKVLIIDQEMAHSVIVGRFKGIVVDPVDIYVMSGIGWKVTNKKHREWLSQHITKLGIKVVIIDTLTTAHEAEENSASEMRGVNDALLGLCRDLGITLIYLHHHRKMQRGESFGQSSSRGSTEIIAKVASHLLVDARDEINVVTGEQVKKMTIQQEKKRLPEFADGKISVEIYYDKNTKLTSWIYKGVLPEKEVMKDQLKERVLELLNNASDLTTKTMIEELKAGEKNLRAALKELETEGKVEVGKVQGSKEKTYSLAVLLEQTEIAY